MRADAKGLEVRVEPEAALDDLGWTAAELWAAGAEVPVEIDASRRGAAGSLLEDENDELSDELEEAEALRPGAVASVAGHLAATGCVVAVRVMASDGRGGPEVGDSVLAWYARSGGILFQVDADGFYDGDELIARS